MRERTRRVALGVEEGRMLLGRAGVCYRLSMRFTAKEADVRPVFFHFCVCFVR